MVEGLMSDATKMAEVLIITPEIPTMKAMGGIAGMLEHYIATSITIT